MKVKVSKMCSRYSSAMEKINYEKISDPYIGFVLALVGTQGRFVSLKLILVRLGRYVFYG